MYVALFLNSYAVCTYYLNYYDISRYSPLSVISTSQITLMTIVILNYHTFGYGLRILRH